MEVQIGNKTVGEDHPTYIICEIGLNHNGNFDLAKEMVREAAECGVDAVKFQKRDIDSLMTKEAYDKPYEGPNSFGKTYGEHRKALELSQDDFINLKNLAEINGVEFLCSAWDLKSVEFLEELDLKAYKIPSADVTNLPLIERIAKLNKTVIMSTGMCTLEEINRAWELLFDWECYSVILLHCISAYPFEDKYANLNIIKTLKKYFEIDCLPIGYSGHEKSGNTISLAAVVIGACVIERHFTLDRTMKGPDHAASLTPEGMTRLVQSIRKIETAMGDGKKEILDIEKPIRDKLGKSIVANREIPRGKVIETGDLIVKCPGTGINPFRINELIGKVASKTIGTDELIKEEMLEECMKQV